MLEVNPTMQINGVVVLSDMTSFSYSHLRWIMTHPRALQERITSIQDAVPMRIKEWIISFANASNFGSINDWLVDMVPKKSERSKFSKNVLLGLLIFFSFS